MKKTTLLTLVFLLLVWCGTPSVLGQEEPAAVDEKVIETLAPAETIAGTISMVLTDQKVVVVVSSKGVSHSFKVTGATHIKIGGQKAKLADLAGQTNKNASVKFSPRRSGNYAQTIEVSP